jgi:hypothetical protein
MSFEFQDEYAHTLDNLVPNLEKSYKRMRQLCSSNLKFDYTLAVANRLRSFYQMQKDLKEFLGKNVAQAGSDFFVETIIFFLKLFNDIEGLDLEIRSEVAIKPKRNSMRPDITIWRGSNLIAVIECKTQLGWHRHSWKSHFENREHQLKEVFPDAKIFLVVMTSLNWPGFGNDEKVDKQLFCLLNNIWPHDMSINPNSETFINRIENLFEQIRPLAKMSNESAVETAAHDAKPAYAG